MRALTYPVLLTALNESEVVDHGSVSSVLLVALTYPVLLTALPQGGRITAG